MATSVLQSQSDLRNVAIPGWSCDVQMSETVTAPRRIRLATPQVITVLFVLIIAVTTTAPIIWSRILEHRLVSVVAPPLEQEFGFRAAYEPVGHDGARVFRLVEVSPEGRLWRGGARAGDLPAPGSCRYAGDYVSAEYFLDGLAKARTGQSVRMTVVRGWPSSQELETIRFGPEPNRR